MARRPKIKSLELRAKVGKVRPEPVTPPLHPDLFRPKRKMRMPRPRFSLADKFFRYFTLFLVFLVLFAVVTGAEYGTYKQAVGAVYYATESVSDFVNATLENISKIIGFVGDWGDGRDEFQETSGTVIAVKIKGKYINFICDQYHTTTINANSWPSYVVTGAPEAYADWVGETLDVFLAWVICPDAGIRVYKVIQKGDLVT